MDRVEIITRTERRRSHSEADRRRILEAADQPGVTVKSVSRQFDVAESLIYAWRAERRKRLAIESEPLEFIGYGEIATADGASTFSETPVRTQSPSAAAPRWSDHVRPDPGPHPGTIELNLPTGIRLRVDAYVNQKALLRVLRCLREAA